MLFLVPLVGPWFGLGYEQSKVLFFFLGMTLAGVLWLKDKPKIKWTPLKLGGLGFLGILGVSSILGISPKDSLLGVEPYYQGFILYAFLFLFFLLVSASGIKEEIWAKTLLLSSLIVSFFATGDYVLLNFFHQNIPTYSGRVVSTFGQPNFYAGFLLLGMPFLGRLGRWGELGMLGAGVGILISGSRIAIVLMLVLLVLFFLGKLKNKLFFWGGGILCAVILGGFLYLSGDTPSGLIWQEFTLPQFTRFDQFAPADGAVEKRYYIWPIVWETIKERPILGYGLENIYPAWQKYFAVNYHAFFEENLKQSSVLIRLKDLGIDRSHNYVLDLLVFSGVLGLLGWLGVVGLMLKKVKSWPIFASLILYLIWVQFQNQSIIHLIYFWLLAGIIDPDLVGVDRESKS
ncbi:MAG: hypothetical protein UU67_C0039G0012 [Candidatus Daviesbacteria bacterium GW2011_GWB1_41_5]|nr:MAG: hypothetical protein UU67_C0039G0012 [Candidatus Daviesbacteria bacterium GW2011_GWB1_41_5]